MLCNRKTWQVREKRSFSARAMEAALPTNSLCYYEVKHSGNNPEANRLKESRAEQVVKQYLHFYRINNFKHSMKTKGQRSRKTTKIYSPFPSHLLNHLRHPEFQKSRWKYICKKKKVISTTFWLATYFRKKHNICIYITYIILEHDKVINRHSKSHYRWYVIITCTKGDLSVSFSWESLVTGITTLKDLLRTIKKYKCSP